jgi:glutathionylspermidine synthase
MKREESAPRADWATSLDSIGLTYHSADGPYWQEEACYALTRGEIEELEQASRVLHQMCLFVVEEVIRRNDLGRLHIPPRWWPAIRRSWERGEPSLYGRFDLCYDGASPPVLLEYNADTPTSLIEASVAQWFWLESTHPRKDQFNTVHDQLLNRWRVIQTYWNRPLYFTGIPKSAEDAQTLGYLEDIARQAGVEVYSIPLAEIGWDVQRCCFVDQRCHPLTALFKLYPWEWLLRDVFGPFMLESHLPVIEPPWKLVLNNKALLVLLWEQFPGHPNLLPAFFTPNPLGSEYVKKPFLSREGANVEIVTGTATISTSGPYGREGWMYQAFRPLPDCAGWHPVIGSWIVGDEPAGIGIRDTRGLITDDTCRFVPHYFDP